MKHKQSSIEWLIEQLKKRGYVGEFPPHLLFEQAKAMHKEEIIETYTYNSAIRTQNKAENYFREKYGKDNADNTAV
jgi:hypothetical protein